MNGPEIGARELLDVLTGYQGAAVVAAACRTGVVDALDAPAEVPELAARTGLDPGALRSLLDALVTLGLARTEPGPSGAPSYAAAALTPRLRSAGDLRPVVAKEAFFAGLWTGLDTMLRTGRPLLAPWRERLEHEPEVVRGFLHALVTLARETGPDLTLLPELGGGRHVVDVGGGLGSYAVPLAAAGARVTLVDLEPVASWAREHLAAVAPTVEVVAADALVAPACGIGPGEADAVLLAHVLHDLSDDDAARLLAGARAALRPGGVVVVVEIPGEGAVGSLFDLMMRLETPGRARRPDELRALLEGAGMVGVRDAPYPRPVLVNVGRRP